MHCGARVGLISARQSPQTGTLEMLVRGVRQIRQSEGKRTEKILCKKVFRPATTVARWETRGYRRFRFSVSRLLKTTSNRPTSVGPRRRCEEPQSGPEAP